MVIDLFGLEDEEVRKKFPEVYQHVKLEVKEKIKINRKGEKEYIGRDCPCGPFSLCRYD
jgi:hypothetical protein